MKKRILTLVIVIVMCIYMVGCGQPNREQEFESPLFCTVSYENYFNVVYEKDTKVMYVVSTCGYNYGNVTLLVNADGTPMIYKGKE